MINDIQHTAISTGDMEQALAFYRDLIGFEVLSDTSWKKGSEQAANVERLMELDGVAFRVAMLRLGTSQLELFEFDSPAPIPGDPNRPVCDHGITHICLSVTDIDSEYERLERAGMRFHCPPVDFGGGVSATYGRDPDGNVVELYERSD
jgi:catechol 2,3-dioxygenase-like lactoylglutathione lyase family enzyme